MARYRCVDTQRADGFPVTAACEAAGVSTSAYYDWQARRDRGPSGRQREDARLLAEIRKIHKRSGGTYGSPRVTAELWRHGWKVNHKKVEAMMRRHGIVGHRPVRRRSLTKADETAAAIPDLVGRRFDPAQLELDFAWAGDITYIRTDQGWLYLASVLDLASRRLLGWSMGEAHDAELVCNAVEAAVAARGRDRMDDTIFHSDRGSEYTSSTFGHTCAKLGLRQSTGRTGSCLDNAVAEAFFATLKVELVNRHRYRTRAEARAAIFAWMHYYNARRLHSTLNYMPPLEWEQQQTLTDHLPSPMAA